MPTRLTPTPNTHITWWTAKSSATSNDTPRSGPKSKRARVNTKNNKHQCFHIPDDAHYHDVFYEWMTHVYHRFNHVPGAPRNSLNVYEAAHQIFKHHAEVTGRGDTCTLAASLLIAFKLMGLRDTNFPVWYLSKVTEVPPKAIVAAELDILQTAHWDLKPIVARRNSKKQVLSSHR